ncbi:beta-glucosidase [Taibaiella lutea]|uniref:Beta-glucosidase n=1 Tax=Taibaiella lutea TaxID=2608001 RepID=A0A5M6CW68_9BACT|nr:beta-glucosidase [Taibaiella lutea]
MNKESFGKDFKWGVSTAAFQIEGSHDTDGKGLSIWDVFTAQKSKIKGTQDARKACDFYNLYKTDINLIRSLNIPNFRFSISWPRLMPNGIGEVNQRGIDYYNRVIDFLLECGIEPWVTLYHWDLPYALELKGGWTNRDIVSWFEDYTELCARSFGDRVSNWMVMNEPSVFTGAGYFLGVHAPGKSGLTNYLKAVHHTTLVTAAAGRVLRNIVPHANIGTTFSCTHIEPASLRYRDQMAAHRVDALLNRTFIEPLIGMGYPQSDVPVLRKLDRYRSGNDDRDMVFDFDFIGLQCYTREIVKASVFTPYIHAALVKAERRNVDCTDMKWEVFPPSIYHILKKFGTYEKIRKIIITENGAAFPDKVVQGKVMDEQRTKYIQDHLLQVLKAKNEGVKVDGYFVWSLTDNFEWAEGYHPRFGLIYVDYDTQERIVKQSGLWLRDFLSEV